MKNLKPVLLLAILINLLPLSSFKNGENFTIPTKKFIKRGAIEVSRISDTELLREYGSPRNIPSRLTANFSEITKTVNLTAVPINNPGVVSPSYVSPSIMFVATVTLNNGWANVTLNSYVEFSGSTTVHATVFNIATRGNVVYFSVNYQWYTDGAWVGSSHGDYSVAM
ncbi:hypothetical protein FHW88_001445 [Mucilaginibacter sp. SG538B]|uniref:hypothetical protein n=1 Tax=Mucilaginibacter sp. SG538B TaxID=2587021 RepID=UPI00159D256F|nr:hypothetical protein [Mucilaginibacter sp. SG538B]NVM63169.1 hypothetical protein [Mucilaginibacter sp. SG538B]